MIENESLIMKIMQVSEVIILLAKSTDSKSTFIEFDENETDDRIYYMEKKI